MFVQVACILHVYAYIMSQKVVAINEKLGETCVNNMKNLVKEIQSCLVFLSLNMN